MYVLTIKGSDASVHFVIVQVHVYSTCILQLYCTTQVHIIGLFVTKYNLAVSYDSPAKVTK